MKQVIRNRVEVFLPAKALSRIEGIELFPQTSGIPSLAHAIHVFKNNLRRAQTIREGIPRKSSRPFHPVEAFFRSAGEQTAVLEKSRAGIDFAVIQADDNHAFILRKPDR